MDSTKLTIIHLFSIVALLPLQLTATRVAREGFSLELIHRDSIHSPLYPGNLTSTERLRRLVRFSDSRILSLETSIIRPKDVNIRPVLAHDDFEYMVKVSIGTPPTTLHLLLDTGSHSVWTQCEPCNPCFPQDGPKYKPNTSRTFVPLPCNHPLCGTCNNGQCVYEVRYINLYTKGILATEQFTFSSKTGRVETIPSVVFGCSHESSNPMFRCTKVGGILGMDGKRESFVTQLASRIEGRFSYCLVPTNNPGTSYLRFGTDVLLRRNAHSTPFVRTNLPHYYLTLLDISVNGQRLNLPPGTFTLNPNGTGGCVIDTGAVITYMITPAYNTVKRSLMDHFRRFNLRMLSGSDVGLDLCYYKPRNFTAFPSMDFHFHGANLHLEKIHLFYTTWSGSKFCLLMSSSDTLTLFGAAQQQNIRFVYDVGRQRLFFSPENCVQS